jgi:hypothetical protein
VAFTFDPMPPIRFEAVGRCIYCGWEDQPLSDEHIIPYGIGGRLVLPEASCRTCSKRTGAIEKSLLRSQNWWPLRRALDLASRRAREQPQSFPVEVSAAGQAHCVDVKVGNYPLVVVVFEFDPPTHLSGSPLPEGGESQAVAQRVYAWNIGALQFAGGFAARLNSGLIAARTELTIPVGMSAHDLSRFLAKVALGWAVAQFGWNAFEELYVSDLIVGEGRNPNRWVGGAAIRPQFNHRALHGLCHGVIHRNVVVYVQLFRPPFGWHEPPTYQVVVGRLRE